jgi:hypothetical protein
MKDSTSVAAPKSTKGALGFIVWWKTDPGEVERQVAGYDTLSIWKSARGISMLLCVLSAMVTLVLGRFFELSSSTMVFEFVMWSILGLFMYHGQRWAFIAGMVLWTLEKASLLFLGATAGRAPIAQLIWWALYMNAFFLAYTVERRRASPASPASRAAAPSAGTGD